MIVVADFQRNPFHEINGGFEWRQVFTLDVGQKLEMQQHAIQTFNALHEPIPISREKLRQPMPDPIRDGRSLSLTTH